MDRPWEEHRATPRTILVAALAPLWIPHFETELEIISGHQRAGDDVHVLTCHREMPSCLANPHGHRYICATCTSRLTAGLNIVNLGHTHRHSLHTASQAEASLPSFRTVSEMREWHLEGAPLGRGAASSLVSILRDPNPDLSQHARLAAHLVETAVLVFRSACAKMEELHPDLVYMFNGRYASTLPVISACETMDIPFVSHELAYELGRYRLVRNGTFHDLDLLKRALSEAWDNSELSLPDRIALGRDFFLGRRQGGHGDALPEYQFARRQTAGALPPGFEGWRGRRVVIFNSSEDEFAAVPSYANPIFANQMDALEALVNDPWTTDTLVTIRVHPNLAGVDNEQTARLRALAGVPNIDVIRAESPIDSYSLIDGADVVVTFGSTVGAEAVFWGRPSVLVGRAAYEDLGVIRPTSRRGLIDAVLARHGPPSPDAIIRYGFFERRWAVEFERYEQHSVRTGSFEGVKVNPTRGAQALSLLLHGALSAIDRDARRELIDRVGRMRKALR